MAERRRRPGWSQLLDRAHAQAAAVENAHRAEAEARAMVAAVLDDDEALLREAIAEWEAARRRVDVAEMLEEVAFAALEPAPVAGFPVGA